MSKPYRLDYDPKEVTNVKPAATTLTELLNRLVRECVPTCNADNCDAQQLAKRVEALLRELAEAICGPEEA